MSDLAPCKTCGKMPDLSVSITEAVLTCGSENCWRCGSNLEFYGVSDFTVEKITETMISQYKKNLGKIWNEHQSGVDTAAKYGAKKRES